MPIEGYILTFEGSTSKQLITWKHYVDVKQVQMLTASNNRQPSTKGNIIDLYVLVGITLSIKYTHIYSYSILVNWVNNLEVGFLYNDYTITVFVHTILNSTKEYLTIAIPYSIVLYFTLLYCIIHSFTVSNFTLLYFI